MPSVSGARRRAEPVSGRRPRAEPMTVAATSMVWGRALAAALVVLAALAPVDAASGGEALAIADLYAAFGPLGLTFSETARRLQGQPVRMRGFMAPPLKAEATFFVLSAQPVSICPFCQSDADWPVDIVVVYPRSGGWRFRAGSEPVEVSGVLELGPEVDRQTGFVSQVRLRAATAR